MQANRLDPSLGVRETIQISIRSGEIAKDPIHHILERFEVHTILNKRNGISEAVTRVPVGKRARIDIAELCHNTANNLIGAIRIVSQKLQLRHLSRDCHQLLSRAGHLMVDSDDDPDYEIAVDYSVRTGNIGGH